MKPYPQSLDPGQIFIGFADYQPMPATDWFLIPDEGGTVNIEGRNASFPPKMQTGLSGIYKVWVKIQ